MEKKPTFKTNMEVLKKVIDLHDERQAIHYFVALNPYTDRSTSECYGDVDWYLELVDHVKADSNLDVCPHLLEEIMECSSEGNSEENSGWTLVFANEKKFLVVACIDYAAMRRAVAEIHEGYSLRAHIIQDITQIGCKVGWAGTCKCPTCHSVMAATIARMCSDFYLDLVEKQ